MAGETSKNESGHGFFAGHPKKPQHSVLASPSASSEFFTIQKPIEAIACALLPDHHFEFDSSFVNIDVSNGLKQLAKLMKSNQGSPISIFAHADPSGKDAYNKTLSGRRASAIYGLLVHDTGVWESLYSNPVGRDGWGEKSLQLILLAIGYNPGRVDGQIDTAYRESVKAFQKEAGLKDDGIAGPKTREKLFSKYMDFLYKNDFKKLDPESDFLGRHADSRGKGDYQGCGECNPLILFSKKENEKYESAQDKSARNAENAPNRRVVAFLFKPEVRIQIGRWPCPRVSEGIDGCKKRFFSDGEKRRSFQAERRIYQHSHDTFACRFYDRLAGNSPCERVLKKGTSLQWIVSAHVSRSEPVLVARSLSGEEIQNFNGEFAGKDETGFSYHFFDIAGLQLQPGFTLQATSSQAPITPEFSLNILDMLNSIVDLRTAASLLGYVFPDPSPPGKPGVEGPDGPDLLDVNTHFENPGVPENPPENPENNEF